LDGHLITLTKNGELHAAKASPEGYNTKTELEVFNDPTWSPPSFAGGKIYARSLKEIACIDIVSGIIADAAKTDPKKENNLVIPGSRFAAFVSEVASARNKTAKIDAFMADQTSFPIYEGDRLVHIVYRGDVKDLALTGDMFEVGEEIAMNHIEGTDFHYASFESEPDAHLTYQLIVDFGTPTADPLNPLKSLSIFGGEASEIFMPASKRPQHLATAPESKQGMLDSLTFESKVLGNSRTIEIYLPPGYKNSSATYPAVYVNYGRMAVRAAKIPNTLDNLIGKSIKPVIAVFIHASNSFQEYSRSQRDQYANMIATELIPFIDDNYRTITEPEARAIMGVDEGGFAAIYVTFKHPGTFYKVAGQSTHLYPSERTALEQIIYESEKQPLTLYLDWGRYDHRNTFQDFNWRTYNAEFSGFMKENGYHHTGGEVPDGFNWACWRNRTDRILETFFPIDN
jgi:enterochelin esterase family protein